MIYAFTDCGKVNMLCCNQAVPDNLWGIRLRDSGADTEQYLHALGTLLDWKKNCEGKFYVIADHRPDLSGDVSGVDFFHFTSSQQNTAAASANTLPKPCVLSCHNRADLVFASKHSIPFVTLSPVFMPVTKKPYQVTPLGIETFSTLAHEFSGLKIFALGGMHAQSVQKLQNCGAFGICGISLFDELFLSGTD